MTYNPTLSLTASGRQKAEEVTGGQGPKYAILAALYQYGPMSYDELSESTNVDHQAIHGAVAELITKGYVQAQ